MPNWCTNTLTITGPKADLAALKEHLARPYSAESIDHTGTPITSTVTGDLLLMNMTTPWSNDEEKQQYDTGYGWYNLNINHWGTKWEVNGELDTHASNDSVLVYNFDSAWSPPTRAVTACAEKWPTLEFVHTYDEPGNDFAGRNTYSGGELTEELETESRSYWCETCDESTYCDFDSDLECANAEAVDPCIPVLKHTLADTNGDIDTIVWALEGSLANIDASLESMTPWEADRLAAAIAASPTVGGLAGRTQLIRAITESVPTVPDWMAGILLTELDANDIDALAHGTDSAVTATVSRGVAHKLHNPS